MGKLLHRIGIDRCAFRRDLRLVPEMRNPNEGPASRKGPREAAPGCKMSHPILEFPLAQAGTENGAEEAPLDVGPKRKKRAWEEDSDEGPDSEDEREKQRQEDQRAKEEFEQRLRDRDEAKTRKLMEAKLSKEEIEASWPALLV